MLTLEEKRTICDEAFDLAEGILGHEVNRSIVDEYPDLIFDTSTTSYGNGCCQAVLPGIALNNIPCCEAY